MLRGVSRRLLAMSPAATLEQCLTHISEAPQDAASAMQRIVELDVDDAATAVIGARRTAILDAARMDRRPTGPARLRACRCIANLALAPDPSAARSTATEATADVGPTGVVTYASALHRDGGAVDLVLSVLERCPSGPSSDGAFIVAPDGLTAVAPSCSGGDVVVVGKARAWAASALHNLCMFDDEAARSAAAKGAAACAAVALQGILADIAAAPSAVDVAPADFAALEACLGAIGRLLSLQVTSDVDQAYYYESAPVVVINAVAAALASNVGLTATHKAWEATRLIAAETDNLPALFSALHKADRSSGTVVLQRWMTFSLEALKRHQPHTTDPEKAHEQLLERHVVLAGMDTVLAVIAASTASATARRSAPTGAAAAADAQSDTVQEEVEGSSSATLLESGLAGLSNGSVSRFAVALLRTVELDVLAPRSTEHPSGRDEAVAVGCLTLLAQLADTDPYVFSTTHAVAALSATLEKDGPKGGLGAAAVEKALTALWNVLNHREGVETVRLLEVPQRVRAVRDDATEGTAVHTAANRLVHKIEAVVENQRYARDKAVVDKP